MCDIKGMDKLKSYVDARKPEAMRETADHLGISRPFLYDLLKGNREPSIAVAVQIADRTGGEVAVTDWPRIAGQAAAFREATSHGATQ